jgi:hypothetical protein
LRGIYHDGGTAMTKQYDWAGSTIIFDTYIEHLRWIAKDPVTDNVADGNPNLYVRTDLRDLIAPADNWEMKAIVNLMIDREGLPIKRERGLFDARALICWRWLKRTIILTKDAANQDFWQRPAETFTRTRGDCDDNSLLLASMLLATGISPYHVRVTVGFVTDPIKGRLGHVWVMYKNESGTWLVLDSAVQLTDLPADPIGLAAAPRAYGEYVPAYCFNRDHVWSVGDLADVIRMLND